MYKLFIGFLKLGEFETIWEAKQYADKSGLTGIFNLIGDKYLIVGTYQLSDRLQITNSSGRSSSAHLLFS